MMKRVYIGNKELTALATVTNGGGGGDDTQKWLDYFNGTLTEFTVPEGVTKINTGTFISFTGLTSLTLPSSIASIGSVNMHGMGDEINPFDTLKTMTVKATTPPTLPKYDIPIPTTISSIYVPKYSANIYKAIDKWNTYADKIQAIAQNETVVTYNDGTTKKFDIKGDLTKDKIENITAATKVEIGDDVTSIGHTVFWGNSSITTIVIPNSVKTIGFAAFRETNITSIIIPDGTTKIEDSMCWMCSKLKFAIIPASVTSIEPQTFRECQNLTSVTIKNSSSKIPYSRQSFEDISSTAKLYVPASVLSDYQADSNWTNAFKGGIFAVENIMKVTYLDNTEMTFNGSTAINQDTDSNKKNAKTVEIYDTVSLINKKAFYNCSGLTSVVIPDSVINIGDSAFDSCKSLTSVEIPDSVINIGDSAFDSCKSLTSVEIPDSVINIGDEAFNSCNSLTSVEIPNSVTIINNFAFGYCSNLESITIPASVTNIGDGAFRECSSLTGITIPASVRSIGNGAFMGCSSLTDITIPASVTSIIDFAFENCSNLVSVTIQNSSSKLEYNYDAFKNISSTAKLYVPSNLLADYQADSEWTGAFKGGIYAIQ